MTSRMREGAGLLRDHWYVAARSDQITTKKPTRASKPPTTTAMSQT